MKTKPGFTLIELLIYIALVSVISAVLGQMFMVINRGRASITSRSAVDSNLRFAIEKIEQDLRAASAITTPAGAGATSTTMVLVEGANIVSYEVSSDGYLQRRFNGGAPENITDTSVAVNTSTFPILFTRLENNNPVFLPAKTGLAIQVVLNIRYRSQSPEWQFAQTKRTTVLLR